MARMMGRVLVFACFVLYSLFDGGFPKPSGTDALQKRALSKSTVRPLASTQGSSGYQSLKVHESSQNISDSSASSDIELHGPLLNVELHDQSYHVDVGSNVHDLSAELPGNVPPEALNAVASSVVMAPQSPGGSTGSRPENSSTPVPAHSTAAQNKPTQSMHPSTGHV